MWKKLINWTLSDIDLSIQILQTQINRRFKKWYKGHHDIKITLCPKSLITLNKRKKKKKEHQLLSSTYCNDVHTFLEISIQLSSIADIFGKETFYTSLLYNLDTTYQFFTFHNFYPILRIKQHLLIDVPKRFTDTHIHTHTHDRAIHGRECVAIRKSATCAARKEGGGTFLDHAFVVPIRWKRFDSRRPFGWLAAASYRPFDCRTIRALIRRCALFSGFREIAHSTRQSC